LKLEKPIGFTEVKSKRFLVIEIIRFIQNDKIILPNCLVIRTSMVRNTQTVKIFMLIISTDPPYLEDCKIFPERGYRCRRDHAELLTNFGPLTSGDIDSTELYLRLVSIFIDR